MKTRDCTSGRWIRMDPPPSSIPFRTTSYARAFTRPGSLSRIRQVLLARRRERMVHRVPAGVLLVPLEKREPGHPEELVASLGDELLLAGDLDAEGAEEVVDGLLLSGGEEEEVAGTPRPARHRSFSTAPSLKIFFELEFQAPASASFTQMNHSAPLARAAFSRSSSRLRENEAPPGTHRPFTRLHLRRKSSSEPSPRRLQARARSACPAGRCRSAPSPRRTSSAGKARRTGSPTPGRPS